METLITLFLCGDVMTGRGIDQVLPHSVPPALHESYVKDARAYVTLAERAHGPVSPPVGYAYVWGDALQILKDKRPQARIINLETSITTSADYWPGKGVHYRMHPGNVPCLEAAGVDCCVLANNHVLDWGYQGLQETLQILRARGIPTAGAGRDAVAAIEPAILPLASAGRILVFAYGLESAGVPHAWAAQPDGPGVAFLPDLSRQTARQVTAHIRRHAEPHDIVVVSLHWGSNWGYDIPDRQVRFAHTLIDAGNVDVIYGHSSHHVRPLEVYRDRLILYGCGDFLNDYEGISGYEEFRDDLTLMYFPALDARTGALQSLELVPLQIRQLSVHRATEEDAQALQTVLNRESTRFGSRVDLRDGSLWLDPDAPQQDNQ